MMVEHQKFGKGKVIHVEGYGGSQKATVFFQGVGKKNLLLKFARLKVVE
jgi:DNA helicase-2/ATP-dependent DNA helicase PcrA